jgi:two-component system CheB/CheR fusion protein
MDSADETKGDAASPKQEADVEVKAVPIREDDISPPRGQPFPIVGIGASAGGLEAFKQLLDALPGDTGMAFVLVQHLDPHYQSQLTELLAPASRMPVQTVTDGMHVEQNKVYVIPENTTMALEDGMLRLVTRKPGLHLPIDTFFHSLAQAQGSRAIGIVLSGNASDGSQGVRAIKGECGLTFAQDEASAKHSGMPRNAMVTGAIDYVLPPAAIARELVNLSRHPYVVTPAPPDVQEVLPEGDGDLKRVFNLLRSAINVDFTHYKKNTVRRRIGRRMIVRRAGSLHEYVKVLTEHPSEVRELYRDLLISVTDFFRDAGAFTALSELLKQRLPKRPATDEPIRIWVPGCATGEEVYSLAICVDEVLDELRLLAPLQIFGTDISEPALSKARTAIYPEAITEDVNPERLRRYFVRMDGGYQISKAIRESCVFARQDVTSDPPFGQTDLISCRNVLIYMDVALQRRVLPVFHYSLKADGLLILGSAETAAAAQDLFGEMDKAHRIYFRKPAPVRLTLNLGLSRHPVSAAEVPQPALSPLNPLELQKRADRILQNKYGPAVVVDADLQILHFRGHTSAYLDPAPGQASLSLLRMARDGLVLPLRRMLESVRQQNVPVGETDIHLESEGEGHVVNVEVSPIAGNSPGERYYLVVFEDANMSLPAIPPDADSMAGTTGGDATGLQIRVRTLEQQLTETREYVRDLTEEHEAHEEELRSANEEIRSSNEELQSTNEELSTAKEEVQSANEELTTINEEMQNRNQELNAVNNDLNNLLSAVSIGIVMADSKLRVRRFNAEAERIFNLKPIDIGRSVEHLRGSFELPHLEHLVQQSLDRLSVEQEDVQDRSGRWYSLAVRPYRSADDHIDGVVITLIDVDPLKRSLATAEEARDYAEGMIETVHEPLVVLDADLRVQRATSSLYNTFQVSRREVLGRFIYDLGNGQWNQPRLRELLSDALFRDKPFQDYEVEHGFPHIGRRTFRLNARRIPRQDGGRPAVLLALEDVSERRELAEVRYRRLFEAAKDGILVIDAEDGTVTDVNPFFLELTGYSREDLVGKELSVTPPFQSGHLARVLDETKEQELVRFDDFPLATKQGRRINVELVGNRYTLGGQEVIQLNVRDMTSRTNALKALRDSEERFRLFVTSVHDYALFQTDLAGRITAWNPGAERLLGFTEEEILGEPAQRLYTPEDQMRGEAEKEMETARLTGRAEDERWHVRKDGSRFFASGILAAVRDDNGRLRGFAKIMRDITERRTAEEQIRTSLREKEVLLKEIHHRVKNNLQVITSLLRLQAEFISDRKAVGLFEEMHSRVKSIATIHEMLYAAHDLGKVDFGAYSQRLTRDLLLLYNVNPSKVGLRVEMQDSYLDISQAVPLGLIVNELLTNALKYGFPDERTGLIHMSLESSDSRGVLSVSDNGIGLPAEVNPKQTTTMGLQLVTLLTDQLDGTLVVNRHQGTRFTISFPLKVE